ncbi:hypothetical protein [Cupriavidus campinensis]|uniref:Uncharacterized protein n=1 Tax=Cupriavidus campinensis TaxID=151783 RepID=A0ABY3ETK1_9BURK|nr:hypothetical protein [Cupriavidus campinensis]TSP14058.1 hypothetical protein FGG12_06200 [Cupriavidus campinensis]
MSMKSLVEAAREVLANWETGDLAGAVHALEGALETVTQAEQTLRDIAAKHAYDSMRDDLEVDDTAFISEADDGIWVSAWLWIPDSMLPPDSQGEHCR